MTVSVFGRACGHPGSAHAGDRDKSRAYIIDGEHDLDIPLPPRAPYGRTVRPPVTARPRAWTSAVTKAPPRLASLACQDRARQPVCRRAQTTNGRLNFISLAGAHGRLRYAHRYVGRAALRSLPDVPTREPPRLTDEIAAVQRRRLERNERLQLPFGQARCPQRFRRRPCAGRSDRPRADLLRSDPSVRAGTWPSHRLSSVHGTAHPSTGTRHAPASLRVLEAVVPNERQPHTARCAPNSSSPRLAEPLRHRDAPWTIGNRLSPELPTARTMV